MENYSYCFLGYIPSVPSEYYPTIETVDLSDNNFAGTIPSTLVYCSHLFEFVASYNKLTGTLPENILSLELYLLKLDNNLFHGTLPSEISSMASLRTLFLYSNYFEGSIVGSIRFK